MLTVKVNDTAIQFDEKTLRYTLTARGSCWEQAEEEACAPRILYKDICESGVLRFAEALCISHERVNNGVGSGIRSRYEGFRIRDKEISYAFETFVWIERVTGDIYFEWIPLCEDGLLVDKVYWPGEMKFDEAKESWYTLLNFQQGLMIPNTWETELGKAAFGGFFGTAGGYMPWIAQIKERKGYIAICTTPWNGGWHAKHPANGPYTHAGIWFEPSLGKMDYRRIVKYTLLDDCDYNDICKVYRTYVKEQGQLRTLREKASQVPAVDDLIGCSFLHMGIKTYVRKESDFYSPEEPDKNNHIRTFAQRAEEIKKLHDAGAGRLYLHLDGWAQPGYDNEHPDCGHICEEAGGVAGMKFLVDTLHAYGDMFGIHDQYRDYYLSAPSYDEEYACRLVDGTVPGHKRWAGGPQTFLCGTQAGYYVKRNFTELEKLGIALDCAYLDVFTCNEGDECANPRHRMTRRECYEARNHCFDYLMSKGILPSSEEMNFWSASSLVFSHYAPYEFMLRAPGSPKYGIPVPLFNLVYHDCLIAPWMMEKISDTEDYMLYALLNGGAPYLIREAAYPDFDGSFETEEKTGLEEDIERCEIVASLHRKVAKCEMVHHEMEDRGNIQKTVFSDGTTVSVNFREQTYEICCKKEV